VWRVLKFFLKAFWKLRWWHQLALVGAAPLLALNLSVSFFGSSAVFPLSPFFLKEKWQALKLYAKHRPTCVLSGHDDLTALAAAAEKKHGLPKGLMRAVVAVESGSRPHRISFAGAMGPAQLMPGTAALLDVEDPFDPAEAIDAGARYLAQQLKRMGRVDLAVAAYNAGPGAVNGSVPKNGETEFYVAKVMKELNASSGDSSSRRR
jgi:soluble lytic murein transglycosylase-like protein